MRPLFPHGQDIIYCCMSCIMFADSHKCKNLTFPTSYVFVKSLKIDALISGFDLTKVYYVFTFLFLGRKALIENSVD